MKGGNSDHSKTPGSFFSRIVHILGFLVRPFGPDAPDAPALPAFPESIHFTPRAQAVLQRARKEAERLNHSFVGTEHLLLGFFDLGRGVAVNVLRSHGLDFDQLRQEVEGEFRRRSHDQASTHQLPYTPRLKRTLSLAVKESNALHHTYLGTEALLLGLLREGEGVAAQILQEHGLGLESCRQEVLRELDPGFESGFDEKA